MDRKSTDQIAGNSESLKRTIRDLENYMDDMKLDEASPLRANMYEKLADVARWWAQEGFYSGHRQSQNALSDDGEIPATLEVAYGTAHMAPNQWQDLTLKSRIKRS
nr:hypothetical protein [Polymorphobacter sp.]